MAKETARIALTGNEAVAEALRQVNPDVAAVFPITPQTELMHRFAEFVNDGKVDTELIAVESEHSAMSATVGASASGVRAITATSANGLALMWEVLYIASGLRLPIVMPVVNRALSGPLNIHCDHSDSMGARDAGWIQIFSENTQEAYDNTLQAFRIAEHKDVMLPTMITLDGFIISHTTEVLEILDDEAARRFVGEFTPLFTLLDPNQPITMGALDLQDYYFEHKRQQVEGMYNAPRVIEQVGKEFLELTGREYSFFEKYRLDDAECAIIVMGSAAGTTKEVVDTLRERGTRAGMIKLRVFRPFPYEQLAQALSHLKSVAVLDRSISFGAQGGPLYLETKAAMYGKTIPICSYIYGLGGRDFMPAMAESAFNDLFEGKCDQQMKYLGLRE
ncbi:MAG: pyruvate ferredoxin oxidoreductase [Candidatus Abyssobacteria bacterium SURF_5]|uniref:Pyruvate ferredoxin oxidoreductase n=1 Tax=Abyssobacteria bacterium (strain SURF_5) TaxID=2093360 RepID=A0A3A4PCH4_ABYX5|nr:MAG: pyruvate ferredoxin oxidoreductase [Candidatus Abyssubacteria bacterium SURF_5]